MTSVDWISAAAITLALLGAGATIGAYVWTGVPALPTSPRVLGAVLAMVDRAPRRRVVDLGSGYGTLVIAVARRCPRASVIGYEVSPVPYLLGRLRLAVAGLPNASLRFANLFSADLREIDLALSYLTREPMVRLKEKLEEELAPGAELICHTFALPGWEPLETVRAEDMYRTPVYRYVRPRAESSSPRHPWFEPPQKERPGPLPPKLLGPASDPIPHEQETDAT